MKYSLMAEAYEKIESTTKRLEMTDYLVEFLKKTPKTVIDKVAYLTQGKLYPDFVGIEIGVAEKLAIRAIAKATGINETQIEADMKKAGDLGATAQKFLEKKQQQTFFQQLLTVEKVYDTLDKIARSTGAGSMDQKINLIAGLLTNASPIMAKLGVFGGRSNRYVDVLASTFMIFVAIAYGGG